MAEELVRERWAEYRAARLDDRPGAFAAYHAALDAEEAAAREFLGRLEGIVKILGDIKSPIEPLDVWDALR